LPTASAARLLSSARPANNAPGCHAAPKNKDWS
jgi:hypothetical protein